MSLSFPLQVACGLEMGGTKVSFSPSRFTGKHLNQSGGSLAGANKLMGLNSKHVFSLHASLDLYTP